MGAFIIPSCGRSRSVGGYAGVAFMKTKSLLLASCLIMAFSAQAVELKPYQKEALEKLEITFGGSWPLVRKQYETAIANASEKDVKMIVDMTVKSRNSGAPGGPAPGGPVPDAGSNGDLSMGETDYDRTSAMRKDIEKQIKKPYKDFMEFVIRIGDERLKLTDEVRNEIFRAENGGRLQGVTEYLAKTSMVSNRAMTEGMETMRLERQKLMYAKQYFKVSFPSEQPANNNAVVLPMIREAGGKIKALNIKYGLICIEIKKRFDAIPYGGGVDINKIRAALYAERESHDRALSAQVKVIVDELNGKIAALDKELFAWAIKPLREAQPQDGPVAAN